jgi:hypothetical protein
MAWYLVKHRANYTKVVCMTVVRDKEDDFTPTLEYELKPGTEQWLCTGALL